MITKLSIDNYALIEHIEIPFYAGFNVITGETGAGKSILVGAISMLFGQRADGEALYNKTKKCIIEGHFSISELSIQSLFETYDLDYDTSLIIRREINTQGKSRAFINDTPVTLNILKSFADKLIDIHSQHHSLLLNESKFQLGLVDQYAGNMSLLDDYKLKYQRYTNTKNELERLKSLELKALSDKDYYSFLFEEISEIDPQIGEEVFLEEELNMLTHAEIIKKGLFRIYATLEEDELSVLNKLAEIKNEFSSIRNFYSQAKELSDRIDSCYIELKDIAQESYSMAEDVSVDGSRMELVATRLDSLNKLFTKHRATTAKELQELRDEFDKKLIEISSLDNEIIQLSKELILQESQLKEASFALTKTRQSQKKPMSEELVLVLNQLGMKHAEVVVDITNIAHYTPWGEDEVTILFSANKGQAPKPIEKVASGGEISRLMLAIKSLIHTHKLIPIAIFDEIDTGVSGDVAAKVGTILSGLAKNMQVIAISHLPQIAAKATSHFWVYKEVVADKTGSNIKLLSTEERVTEIAQMISGAHITDAAKKAAQDLLSEK